LIENVPKGIAAIHGKVRNGGFLRSSVPIVTLIKVKDGGTYGIGHMKAFDSYGKDFLLTAQNATDKDKLDDIVNSDIIGEYVVLDRLADANRFKNDKLRAGFGFVQNFGQYHLIVTGKDTYLHYKVEGNSGVPEFDIDFRALDIMLAELARAGSDSDQFAKVLLKNMNNLEYYWFKTTSFDGKVEVLAHWPTLLEKYLNKK
jgi:hypothetical protein